MRSAAAVARACPLKGRGRVAKLGGHAPHVLAASSARSLVLAAQLLLAGELADGGGLTNEGGRRGRVHCKLHGAVQAPVAAACWP